MPLRLIFLVSWLVETVDGRVVTMDLSIGTALSRLKGVCPAACSCAKGISTVAANATHRDECGQVSVKMYLKRVYPTAASRISEMSFIEANQFFWSLHFYYDHGCATASSHCSEPGAQLRFIYPDLLPCNEERGRPARGTRMAVRACVATHFRFAPVWATELARAGWAEVEHRAVGLGVRYKGQLPG